jgi:hypothetical protein
LPISTPRAGEISLAEVAQSSGDAKSNGSGDAKSKEPLAVGEHFLSVGEEM